MQSCVHSFFLPDGPTHLHEREGDGKRNILWGWPNITRATATRIKSPSYISEQNSVETYTSNSGFPV